MPPTFGPNLPPTFPSQPEIINANYPNYPDYADTYNYITNDDINDADDAKPDAQIPTDYPTYDIPEEIPTYDNVPEEFPTDYFNNDDSVSDLNFPASDFSAPETNDNIANAFNIDDNGGNVDAESLCHVIGGDSNIVLDIVESFGNDISQPTRPRILPVYGKLTLDFIHRISIEWTSLCKETYTFHSP